MLAETCGASGSVVWAGMVKLHRIVVEKIPLLCGSDVT